MRFLWIPVELRSTNNCYPTTVRTDTRLIRLSQTPRSRVFLEKLTGSQIVKRFTAFYGARMFITAFTSARHLSLSWDRLIQSIAPHPTSWRSILILSSHLRLSLPSGLFPSGFHTKPLYSPVLVLMCATCLAHLILFDLTTQKILDEQYRSLTHWGRGHLTLRWLMSYIYIYIYIYIWSTHSWCF